MEKAGTRTGPATEDATVVGAAQAGDEGAFAELAERYRGELHVHCYRLLGSFDEAEDLVQETFLRAWRKRATYQARSTFRAWLYRIATNACLDALEHRPAARKMAPPAEPDQARLPPAAIPWLQPYPDQLLDAVAPSDIEPDAAIVAKETIELAFLAAIQRLPPRQRAVLILRDVLGWSARETAQVLQVTVAAVNSALQRARPMLKDRLPPHRLDWRRPTQPTSQERAVLRRYMEAIERSDDAAIADLLLADARLGQQSGAGGHRGAAPAVVVGRDAIIEAWAPLLHSPDPVQLRFQATSANRQPAAATYVRWDGAPAYQPFALAVLDIRGGAVAEVSVFRADRFPAFQLPERL